MLSVQCINVRLVNFWARHLYKVYWSIHFHFNEWNSSCFNKFETCNPWLLVKQLLKLLKSSFKPGIFGHVYKVVKNWVINSDINVTVLDGNTRSAWAKKFDGYFPQSEHELYSFISDDSPLVKFIGLLIDQVAVLLNIVLKFAKNFIWVVDFRNSELFINLRSLKGMKFLMA